MELSGRASARSCSKRGRRNLVRGLATFYLALFCQILFGATNAQADDGVSGAFTERLDTQLSIVAIPELSKPSDNSKNPDNVIYQIPRYSAQLELRPKLSYKFDSPDRIARIEPRFRSINSWIEDGINDGERNDDHELYIGRYLLRDRQGPIALALTRDDLQFGPAYLTSPSNPFSTDNSQNFPFDELRGSDFAEITWTPNFNWSLKYLFNYGEGYDPPDDSGSFGEFHKAHALKLDHYADTFSYSLILAAVEDQKNMAGLYGQWTVGEAVLFYWDTAIRQGSQALYPVLDPDSPVGGSLEATKEDSDRLYPEILVGTSYTTPANYTFYLEYFFYSPGYSSGQYDQINQIADESSAFSLSNPGDPAAGRGFENLNDIFFDGLRYQGRHEMLAQMSKNAGDYSFVSSNVLNPVDGSGYLYGSVVYAPSLHKWMLAGRWSFGSTNDEHRAAVDHILTLGYMYTL